MSPLSLRGDSSPRTGPRRKLRGEKLTGMQEIARFLKEKHRFLVVSHARPDGDAIGSILALALALQSAGKQVDVIGSDSVPHNFRKLPGADLLHVCKEVPAGAYDAAVILECSNPERTGVSGLEKHFLINIDHHTSAGNYGQLNWVDMSFGAVGQMVFRLIEGMGIAVTPAIAENLYVALVTDTGDFQFGNTTTVELGDARRLVELGAVPAEIAEQIYHTNTPQKIRLLSAVLSTLEMDESQRVAWVYMTREMLARTGASPEDTEGIVNHLLTIETVRVAAFFKQDGEGGYKLSLRSKGALDVAHIAKLYDGGGHQNAAGFTIHADFETAKRQVLAHLRDLLELSSSN